eukprot:scaffold9191_cov56-Phaeocystis_antarctica.AAC.1
MARWMAPWCEPLLGEASVAPGATRLRTRGAEGGRDRTRLRADLRRRPPGTRGTRHLLQPRSCLCRRQRVQGLCIRLALGFGSLAREPCRTGVRACRARRRRSDSEGS